MDGSADAVPPLPSPKSQTTVLEPPRTPSPKDVHPASPARGGGVAAVSKLKTGGSPLDTDGGGGGGGGGGGALAEPSPAALAAAPSSTPGLASGAVNYVEGFGDEPPPPTAEQMAMYAANKGKMLEAARKHGCVTRTS